MSVYIIAEAGVNHNGSLEMAKRLIDAAKIAGADCVKFQTFQSEKLVSASARKAVYQFLNTKDTDDSQLDMLKRLELSYCDFKELSDYCGKVGITFLSTPFDLDSIDFLSQIDMPFWKVPSGEVTNLPYLVRIAQTHKPVVMSTGMCNITDIDAAINILKIYGAGEITLLHCNTEYPTPFGDVNLLAMNTLHQLFGTKVGYSDHTKGIEVPISAVALGAQVIEKHFTLDRELPGPDHKASLEPQELRAMITAIRNVEVALGKAQKIVTESERKNIQVARKSIVACRHITAGEILSEDNITVKRPGNGISPMKWFDVIGSKAIRDFEIDELIEI